MLTVTVITIQPDCKPWAGMVKLYFLVFATGLSPKAVSGRGSRAVAHPGSYLKAKRTYLGGNSLCCSRASARTFCRFTRYPVVRALVPSVANKREALRPVSNLEKALAILPLG